MESVIDLELDWVNLLPSELWFHAISFLDPSWLLSIRRVCKLFNHLATEESLWKRIAFLMAPNPQILKDGENWLQICEQLYGLDIEGNWNMGIAMDMNLAEAVYPLTYELKAVLPKRLERPEVACGLIGAGTAPWGEFENLSIQWGNYFTNLHIYQWNLWLTCYVGEISSDSLFVHGTWKTTWQYASGTFAGNHLHHLSKSAKSKVLELIAEHRLNWKATDYDYIVQSYCATFSFPQESFDIVFTIVQKKIAGFKAFIHTQTLGQMYTTNNFIGSIKGDILGFTVLLCSTDQSQKAAIVGITQIQKVARGIKLYGKFALQINEQEEVRCGEINVRSLTKEEIAKLKPGDTKAK